MFIAGIDNNSANFIVVPNQKAFHDSFRFFDSYISDNSDYRTSLPVSGYEAKDNCNGLRIEMHFIDTKGESLT